MKIIQIAVTQNDTWSYVFALLENGKIATIKGNQLESLQEKHWELLPTIPEKFFE